MVFEEECSLGGRLLGLVIVGGGLPVTDNSLVMLSALYASVRLCL